MLRGLTQKLIRASCGAAMMICASLLASGPLRAAPDTALLQLDAQLSDLSAMLKADPLARGMPLAQLLLRTGLSGLTDELPRPERAAPLSGSQTQSDAPLANATVENLRTALAVLTQTQGGQDNLDVLLAQPQGSTDALTFRGGRVTLEHIRHSLRALNLQTDMRPGQDTLRVPVILWQDTVLQLGPQDHLALSRPDGAFLISFGRAEIDRSRIFVAGGDNFASKDFVPFVTIAGGGSLKMTGAALEGLGFGNSPKFSGLSVVAHSLLGSTGESEITGSHFENLVTVSISGTQGTSLSGNRFYNMRNNALLLETATAALVQGNLFFGDGPTNSVRVLKGADDTVVRGNVLLEGARSGILVQGQSNRVEVSGNVIWRRSGGAIKLSRTECGLVRHNVILNSQQKGVDIRSSDKTTVQGNTISGSRSSGIWVSSQRAGAQTFVSENILKGNKAGLATATGAELVLVGNDFSNQFPRLIDGDLTLQNRAIAMDLRGDTPIVLTAFEALYPRAAPTRECQGRGQP